MIEIIEAVALGLGVFVAIEWSARNNPTICVQFGDMVLMQSSLPLETSAYLRTKEDVPEEIGLGCGSCLLAWQKTMGMIAINLGLVLSCFHLFLKKGWFEDHANN